MVDVIGGVDDDTVLNFQPERSLSENCAGRGPEVQGSAPSCSEAIRRENAHQILYSVLR
jgi:hypothetical protein